MADLELDTTLERIGENRFRAVVSEDWKAWGPNGGYIAAIALRAAGTASRFNRPASYAGQYLSFAEFEEVELEVEMLRSGRTSEALRVSMLQKSKRVHEALVWTVDENEGIEYDFTRSPDVPPPDQLPNTEEIRGAAAETVPLVWGRFEQRPVGWVLGETHEPGEPEIRCWCRFRPRAVFDDPFVNAARSMVLLDIYSWGAVYGAHSGEVLPWIAPNLDLHMRFHRWVESEWLYLESRAELASSGLIGSEGRVWSAKGELIASGDCQLWCRPRPARFY